MLQHLNPNITNTKIDAKLKMDFAIWFKAYVSLLFLTLSINPTPNMGIRVHEQYNIVEKNQRRKYDKYEPFVLAMQAVQVYFCSYPSLQKDKVD